MSVAEQYEQACATPSDIVEHLPTFVSLVKERNVRKVVELGCRTGVSTVAWLYGIEQTGGHLWSVDIDPAPVIESGRWTFIQGDDTDQNIFRQLPSDADIVFIDTSHMYAHTLAELNLYRWKLLPGGMFVLHDTELARPEGWTRAQPVYPVKTAVQEFCADEGLEAQFFGDSRFTNNGLGLIGVP